MTKAVVKGEAAMVSSTATSSSTSRSSLDASWAARYWYSPAARSKTIRVMLPTAVSASRLSSPTRVDTPLASALKRAHAMERQRPEDHVDHDHQRDEERQGGGSVFSYRVSYSAKTLLHRRRSSSEVLEITSTACWASGVRLVSGLVRCSG